MKHPFLRYLATLCFLIASCIAIGQTTTIGEEGNTAYDAPSVIPPSPTVAALMQFEEVPVDLYTGIPSIGIPIFSSALDQNLGFNLGLSYHPEGIKVDNRSGWTGTGWSVTGLGAVSRTVLGHPDEYGTGVLHQHNAPGIDSYYDYDDFGVEEKNNFLYEVGKGRLDTEPDVFQFSAFGISGRFMIIRGNGPMRAIQLGGDQKLRIEFDSSGGPTTGGNFGGFSFKSFIITDQNGYQYIFGINGRETTNNFPLSTAGSDDIVIPEARIVHSAWNLTEVKSYSGATLLKIAYNTVTENYKSSSSFTRNVGAHSGTSLGVISNPQEYAGPAFVENWQEMSVATKKVSKILIRDGNSGTTTDDLVTIDFYTNTGHPEYGNDLEVFPYTNGNTSVTLDRIEIKHLGLLNKTINFQYHTSSTSRLILDGVTEVAGSEILPYTFQYNGVLPEFGDPGRDHWGYFNGNNPPGGSQIANSMTNNAFRAANENTVTTGILENITYPTGGVKEFDFESNTRGVGDTGPQINTVPHTRFLRDINLPASQNEIILGVINLESVGNTQVTLTVHNIDIDQAEEKIQFTMSPVTGPEMGSPYNCLCGIPGNSDLYDPSEYSAPGPISFEIHFPQTTLDKNEPYGNTPSDYSTRHRSETENIVNGLYLLKIDRNYGNHILLDDFTIDVGITTYRTEVDDNGDQPSFSYGGGVRIKEVRFSEQEGSDLVAQTTTQYNYEEFDQPNTSSGSSHSNYGISSNFYFKYVAIPFDSGDDASLPDVAGVNLYTVSVTSTHSESNVVPVKGGYVGYENVSVNQYDPILGTNGKTQYTYASSRNSKVGGSGIPYTPIAIRDYAFGNLLKQEVFDAQGRMLTSTINTYQIEEDTPVFGRAIRFAPEACPVFHSSNTYGEYKNNICNNPSYGGSPCLAGDPSTCSAPGFLENIQYSFSNRSYPYFSGRALMKSSATTSYFYDTEGTQTTSTQRSSYTYNDYNNRPSEQLTRISGEAPILTRYYFPFDEEVNDVAGISALMADHRLTEIILSETSQQGELLFTEQRNFSTTGAVPRVKDIQTQKLGGPLEDRLTYHSYNNFNNPLEVSREDGIHSIYIWGYNSMYPIAQITNASYSDMPVSVSNQIDAIQAASNTENSAAEEASLRTMLNNLRNDPFFANAQMTTATYDPVVGVTSQTDPRGYTMYYEYDDLNRLKRTLDQNGKVYSTNEYNYQINE